MSRKHPQNGPSLSKAPHKKQKPLDDKELAERQAQQRRAEEAVASRVGEAQQKVASGKRFGAAVKANGGCIPLRGGNADEFWSKIREQDSVAASTSKARARLQPRAK